MVVGRRQGEVEELGGFLAEFILSRSLVLDRDVTCQPISSQPQSYLLVCGDDAWSISRVPKLCYLVPPLSLFSWIYGSFAKLASHYAVLVMNIKWFGIDVHRSHSFTDSLQAIKKAMATR